MIALDTMVRNKNTIFVDFFDTVMFRYVHSDEIRPQWAKRMHLYYPNIDIYEWINARSHVISGNDECSFNYSYLTKSLYSKLCEKISDEYNVFHVKCYEVDKYVDMASQYPNVRIVSWLKKQKEQGKKIYIVSDYYLPSKTYYDFLEFYNLNDIFDGFFSSADYECTKRSGLLYEKVLHNLNIDKKNVLMIGDSKTSDYLMPQRINIESYRYFPLVHKIYTNIHKKFKIKKISCSIFNKCYKYTNFTEYGMDLYAFCVYLSELLKRDFNKSKNINFMSRGGYLLKKAFDMFIEWNPSDLNIYTTNYMRFSRKVSWGVSLESEAGRNLLEYLEKYIDNNELLFVDEGWYGHSQDALEEICPWSIKGYYLGLIRNSNGSDKRKGVLFGEDANNIKSPFYGVFRTNCTLYEQFLTAPHGSLISIKKDENNEFILEEQWADQEKDLYEKYTLSLQNKLLDCMRFLLAWDINLTLYELAKYKLKSLLFGNKEKVKILNMYDKNYYNNFTTSQEKGFGKISSMRINVFELLVNPENYMRYFCKIRERQNSSIMWNIIYYIFVPLIYVYCYMSILIKHLFLQNKS